MKPEDRYAWYMEDIWSVIVPSFYPTPSSYIPPLYILNVFILFIYLFIYLLAVLNGMWNLSSLTRDGIHTVYTGSVTTGSPEMSLPFIISIFFFKELLLFIIIS